MGKEDKMAVKYTETKNSTFLLAYKTFKILQVPLEKLVFLLYLRRLRIFMKGMSMKKAIIMEKESTFLGDAT
jgi:hypothetical protein